MEGRITRLARKVALAQARVDVARAEAARKAPEQVRLFVRGSRCTEEAEPLRPALLHRLAQHRRGGLESLLPAGFLPAALLAQHRSLQPVGRVNARSEERRVGKEWR